jgi:hypothetical protein
MAVLVRCGDVHHNNNPAVGSRSLDEKETTPKNELLNRRDFGKSTAGAAVVAAGTPSLARSAHAAASDKLKLGVVGFGDRGASAAVQALSADAGTELYAIGDAFEDRMEERYEMLQAGRANSIAIANPADIAARSKLPPDRRYVGFDAYKHVNNGLFFIPMTVQATDGMERA